MYSSAKTGEEPRVSDTPADRDSPPNPAAPSAGAAPAQPPPPPRGRRGRDLSWPTPGVPPSYSFHPRLNIPIEVGRVGGGRLNDVLVAWTDLITLPPLVLSNPSGNQTVSH